MLAGGSRNHQRLRRREDKLQEVTLESSEARLGKDIPQALSLGYWTNSIATLLPATAPVFVTVTAKLNITSHSAGLPPWLPPAGGSGCGVVWYPVGYVNAVVDVMLDGLSRYGYR